MSYSNQTKLANSDNRNLPPGLFFEYSKKLALPEKNLRVGQLFEQQLFWKKYVFTRIEQSKRVGKKKALFKSENSIWDTVKLLERFKKPEYSSLQAKKNLLKADAIHHAKEMALVEPITRFSYWHTVSENESLGEGYYEDMGFMMNTFAQDLAQKGLNASRATIETITFEKARKELTQIALSSSQNTLKQKGILITSFPDSAEAGYHGVDSKHNWDKPETHHSFFYLLTVGDREVDSQGNVTRFKIETTQYRAWPNARQALQLHEQLQQPILKQDAPIPNLLFANLIHLDQEKLQQITQNLIAIEQKSENTNLNQSKQLTDEQETQLEKLFKILLHHNSEQHAINFTQLPEVNQKLFWDMQEQYFTGFYLSIALPVFEEIAQLQKNEPLDLQTQQLIQTKIDYLDKAFFYYSKILLGWIKVNNTNPNYTEAFKEKNQFKILLELRQKLLLRVLGQKESQNIPSVSELKMVLDIDHRLATKQRVSTEEKKKLLSIWGFFSFVGNFGSLLQCGTIAPFTLPISIMNRSFNAASSLSEFTSSIANIPIPEKQQFLNALQHEEYVELDLTKQKPIPAKRIYTVPKSYLTGAGCVVDKNGSVLGPCFETQLIDGKEVKVRISLDDPRDTIAFPMTLVEFNQYVKSLQKSIQQTTLSEIDSIFQTSDFSVSEKRKVQKVIKKLRQKLIKKSLDLQDFVSGDLTLTRLDSDNKWLQSLVLRLSFSLNPVKTLIEEVEEKLKENEPELNSIVDLID